MDPRHPEVLGERGCLMLMMNHSIEMISSIHHWRKKHIRVMMDLNRFLFQFLYE